MNRPVACCLVLAVTLQVASAQRPAYTPFSTVVHGADVIAAVKIKEVTEEEVRVELLEVVHSKKPEHRSLEALRVRVLRFQCTEPTLEELRALPPTTLLFLHEQADGAFVIPGPEWAFPNRVPQQVSSPRSRTTLEQFVRENAIQRVRDHLSGAYADQALETFRNRDPSDPAYYPKTRMPVRPVLEELLAALLHWRKTEAVPELVEYGREHLERDPSPQNLCLQFALKGTAQLTTPTSPHRDAVVSFLEAVASKRAGIYLPAGLPPREFETNLLYFRGQEISFTHLQRLAPKRAGALLASLER